MVSSRNSLVGWPPRSVLPAPSLTRDLVARKHQELVDWLGEYRVEAAGAAAPAVYQAHALGWMKAPR